MRLKFSALAACVALALANGCSTTERQPTAAATTGTDTASVVNSTGDPTAGTTATPAGVPTSGI